jgi:hypothetical protein
MDLHIIAMDVIMIDKASQGINNKYWIILTGEKK